MQKEYTKGVAIEREYDRLLDRVHSFGLDHINTVGWKETIGEAYTEVWEEIDSFRSKTTMLEMDSFLEKIDQLEESIRKYKDRLYERAEAEPRTPALNAVNLSTRLSVMDLDVTEEQQQHPHQEQDTIIQPGNSSTPSNDLGGVEVMLNSNNSIQNIQPRNTPTPPVVLITDEDSGARLLNPAESNTDIAYDQANIRRGENSEDFLKNLQDKYELNSATQGDTHASQALKNVIDQAKESRLLYDKLSAEMINIKNDQTRRIVSLEQGLAKANTTHSALASEFRERDAEFRERMSRADNVIGSLNSSVGRMTDQVDLLNSNIVRVNTDFTTFVRNQGNVVKEVKNDITCNKNNVAIVSDQITLLKNDLTDNARIISGLRSTLQIEQRKLENYMRQGSSVVGSIDQISGSINNRPGPRPNYDGVDPQFNALDPNRFHPSAPAASDPQHSDPFNQRTNENVPSTRSVGNIHAIDNSAFLSQDCRVPQDNLYSRGNRMAHEAPTALLSDTSPRIPTSGRRMSSSLPSSPVSSRHGAAHRTVCPPTYIPQMEEQVSGITIVNASDSTRAFLEDNIQLDAAALKIAVMNKLDKYSSEIDIKEARITGIAEANQLALQLRSKLDQYIRYPDYNKDLFLTGRSAIILATEWVSNIRILCNELKLSSSTKNTGIGLKIKTFTGNGEQTIFQFFRDCERTYRGKASGEEKAEKIYREHLDPYIQSITSNMSSDYKRLKEFLIKEYGHYLKVTEALIGTIELLGVPARNDSKKRSEYFMKFRTLLEKLETLPDEDGIDKEKMMEHIRSPPVLNRLSKLLSWEDEQDYIMDLPEDIDANMLTGNIPFNHLVKFVKRKVKAATRTAARQPERVGEKPKGKSVQISESPSINPSKAPAPVLAPVPAQQHQSQSAHAARPGKHYVPTVIGWADPKFKNPCPMNGHEHEVQECTEFFAKNSFERQDIAKGKMCLTCFGIKEKCNKVVGSEMCSNMDAAKQIICVECISFRNEQNLKGSPFNIFFCLNRAHQKFTNDQGIELLKNFAPKVSPEKIPKNVFMSSSSWRSRTWRRRGCALCEVWRPGVNTTPTATTWRCS